MSQENDKGHASVVGEMAADVEAHRRAQKRRAVAEARAADEAIRSSLPVLPHVETEMRYHDFRAGWVRTRDHLSRCAGIELAASRRALDPSLRAELLAVAEAYADAVIAVERVMEREEEARHQRMVKIASEFGVPIPKWCAEERARQLAARESAFGPYGIEIEGGSVEP